MLTIVRCATLARVAATGQLMALIVSAPEELRAELRGRSAAGQIHHCAGPRTRSARSLEHQATVRALRATAQFEDQTAGQLVERIGREIIRRSLKATEPELSHHQGRHYYWKQLCKFAGYEPGSPDPSNPEWHHGIWVPRTAGQSMDPAS